jgi:LuxR family maltose regulon positive regulatory protein
MELALDVAEDTGHRWTFAMHRSARPLLQDCIRAGTSHRALVAEALEIIENAAPPPDAELAAATLLDPLTPRERLILEYLPTRFTNAEIAKAIGVTSNTVKTHLRAVYRKLDAADRGSAVVRARELRLLRRDR